MKLFSESYAGQALALSTGKIIVDSKGVAEAEGEAVERLLSIGFQAIGPFKEENKEEAPAEAVGPYIPELHADLPERKEEELKGEAVEESKKQESKPRFKRNK